MEWITQLSPIAQVFAVIGVFAVLGIIAWQVGQFFREL